jgi:hypothetical protein
VHGRNQWGTAQYQDWTLALTGDYAATAFTLDRQ